jgi:hypothetical protein
MLKRELKRYIWEYANGVVTLVDKKQGTRFELPLYYLDSLTRASITFKNAHRIEQVEKAQERAKKAQVSKAQYRAKVEAQSKKTAEYWAKRKALLKQKWQARLKDKKTRRILTKGDITETDTGVVVTFTVNKDEVKRGQKLVCDIVEQPRLL